MLPLDAGVDVSFVMSSRRCDKSFTCVKLEKGDTTVQELSTSGFDCSSCEFVSAVFCQGAAFCARVAKQIHVWINSVAQ